jgi:hypothetical protein
VSRWLEIGRVQRDTGPHTCEILNARGQKDPGCSGRFDEGHHGIFPGEASRHTKAWRHFLDHPINYTRSCHACNISRISDPQAARDLRFTNQLRRYGSFQVRPWLRSAPVEVQARPEWKRYMKEASE